MATKLQDSLVRKIQENRELKDTIKDLHTQAEKDKAFLREVQDEVEKYLDLYSSTRIVAQALAEAVYFLTKEKQHG